MLSASVAEFNAAISAGADPELGRDLSGARSIAVPPLHAIQYLPLVQKNLGGVRTDEACRVVTADGAAIERLFAAGEVAGMAGGHINGSAALEGAMFGPCIYSGRLAGRAAALSDQAAPVSPRT